MYLSTVLKKNYIGNVQPLNTNNVTQRKNVYQVQYVDGIYKLS